MTTAGSAAAVLLTRSSTCLASDVTLAPSARTVEPNAAIWGATSLSGAAAVLGSNVAGDDHTATSGDCRDLLSAEK